MCAATAERFSRSTLRRAASAVIPRILRARAPTSLPWSRITRVSTANRLPGEEDARQSAGNGSGGGVGRQRCSLRAARTVFKYSIYKTRARAAREIRTRSDSQPATSRPPHSSAELHVFSRTRLQNIQPRSETISDRTVVTITPYRLSFIHKP